MVNLKCGNIIAKIKGITCNSREVKPGYAFVAIQGYKDDGHKYIEEAVERGASIVYTEKEINLNKVSDIPILQVKDSRACLAHMAAEYYDHPSQHISLIGITGTNGKTTTTHLIYNLLNYNNKKCGLIGTVKIDSGKEIKPGKLTTPEPIFLQKTLKDMVTRGLKYAAMEVSSHGIKLKRIVSTDFALKVGTNITEDHYDFHDSFREYKTVKKNFLSEKDNNIPVLLNYDDPHLRSFDKIASNQIYFGLQAEAAITARYLEIDGLHTRFIYSLKKPIKGQKNISPVQFPLDIYLPGKHNIYNTLVAVTIALYCGIEPRSIQQFFRDYRGVWRRLEVVYRNKFTIIDDCAHNPGSYRAVLSAVLNISHRKIHIINAIRGNRGTLINKINARTIALSLVNKSNYNLYITECTDTAGPDDRVTAKEKETFLDELQEFGIQFNHFSQLQPVLKQVLEQVKKEEIILLLGAHAMDNAGKMILNLLHTTNQTST